jgi:hypothetical protein
MWRGSKSILQGSEAQFLAGPKKFSHFSAKIFELDICREKEDRYLCGPELKLSWPIV